MRILPIAAILLATNLGGRAASERDWQVPPRGIEIDETDRAELLAEMDRLGAAIDQLRSRLDLAHLALLPDVAVFHKAVQWALEYDEFYGGNEVAAARRLLKLGHERAGQLGRGDAPWLTATGLVVRGYISAIDGSTQPYGLVVPATYSQGKRHRLDVWLHGRDNNLTELKFINDRLRSPGQFMPPDTLVLHPYGRFCNAFKFAGETDVLEALEHVQSQYRVDDLRVAVRGFSMGGAGCWHLAVHHADVWSAAAPGAGFAETADYTGVLRRSPQPPWYEQRLWHWYDATDYALNLFHCPTIAYSGEIDKQKQAADIMERAIEQEGLELRHIVGPDTAHRYEPGAKAELERQFDGLMTDGQDADPEQVRLTTWTLKYPRMHWASIEGMEHHWDRARLEAALIADLVAVNTKNVTGISLNVPSSFRLKSEGNLIVDGVVLTLPDSPGKVILWKAAGTWIVAAPEGGGFAGSESRKRPGLQGPIDDAFMGSFLMVSPTGEPLNEALGNWVTRELTHATNEWRAQFRGDARVKEDASVTEEDIANHHLILWGDPRSNRLLSRILDRLPLQWTADSVRLGAREFSPSEKVPVLIYPNPLNPDRYVVINSGFTFCEFGKASNALQTPKLPDYAVLDMSVPIEDRHPAGVVMAGFFGEHWELSTDSRAGD